MKQSCYVSTRANGNACLGGRDSNNNNLQPTSASTINSKRQSTGCEPANKLKSQHQQQESINKQNNKQLHPMRTPAAATKTSANRQTGSIFNTASLAKLSCLGPICVLSMGALLIVAAAAAAPDSSPIGATAGPATPRSSVGGSPLLALESSIANAKVKLSDQDMATAAGHHHGKSHGKYYMYAEVPKKHSYKMGFKRGNHKHEIERKESAHKSHVHSYFKWHDKKGKGEHKFEFKHYDHKKKHHH